MCAVCGEPMTGRADRKFCSAACRQKSHREKAQRDTRRDVTAKPFITTDEPQILKRGEPQHQFWEDFHNVHETLMLSDPEFTEWDDEYLDSTPYPVPLDPPVRRADDENQRQFARQKAERDTADFLRDYDVMLDRLARMRATVEAIREHHGWT